MVKKSPRPSLSNSASTVAKTIVDKKATSDFRKKWGVKPKGKVLTAKNLFSSSKRPSLSSSIASNFAEALSDTKPKADKKGESRKVLIALSGGIDSAVSAHLLLKQGYEVEAAYMKNWSSTKGLKYDECPWLVDRQDALRVAAFLRIPLHTLDFEKQYEKKVLNYFFKEYATGRTPNPDVMCNKEVKFKLLYNWAMKNGFDYLATGHYAQVSCQQSTVSCQLLRSADEFKDQTYFIYNIKTEQLPHILFPIGGMKKTAVRAMARKIKLPNAEKRESMGLCFVGRIRLKDFLDQKLKPKTGKIVDQDGNTIGEHQGLHIYTIGQRQGIKVGGSGPYYVSKKDLKKNILYVTNNPNDKALEVKEIEIHSVNFITPPTPLLKRGEALQFSSPLLKSLRRVRSGGRQGEVALLGRFRHQGDLIPLVIETLGKDHYKVTFKKPQKAIASGQSLVLYKGKECVGGGVIV
jgi:tRNA-specific 2-thiouridylase